MKTTNNEQKRRIRINGVQLEVNRNGEIKMLQRKLKNGRIQKERICKPQDIGNGYQQIGIMNKKISPRQKFFLVSRIIAKAFILNPDNLPCVDHVDGNPRNNRVENLRWTTPKQNSRSFQKKRANTTSKYRGVFKLKNYNKWEARIWAEGERKYLGLFDTELDAGEAYNQACEQYGYSKEAQNILTK